jgi:hypothetical protein
LVTYQKVSCSPTATSLTIAPLGPDININFDYLITVMTAAVRTRAVSGVAEPEGAGVVPIGLLVNHDRFLFGIHEHPPKGERKGNDRDD